MTQPLTQETMNLTNLNLHFVNEKIFDGRFPYSQHKILKIHCGSI
jgi:hypothetical protein